MLEPSEIARLKASADLPALFAADGSDVQREGARHKTCCPFHAERSPSCYLFDDGHFKCFGCGATGDAIEYLMRRRSLDFTKACEALGAAPQRATPAKIDRRRKYDVVMPVPANAPRCSFAINAPDVGAPTAVWWYLSATGAKLMAVVRYPVMENGKPRLDDDGKAKKTIRSWCWARRVEDGSTGWQCTRPGDGLPLYGLDRLAARPDAPVVLVEGEKSADAARDFLPDHVAVTWPGGARNADRAEKVNWSPLAGRTVILWPDFDKIGALVMSQIADHLRAAGAASIRVIDLRRLEGRGQGWDVADGTRDDAEVIIDMLGDDTDATLKALLQSLPGELDQRSATDATAAETTGPGAGGPTDQTPPTANGQPEPDDIEANDIAAATAFVEDHQRRVLYCPTWDRWHVWDGRRWKGDDQGAVFRLAEQTALRIARDYLAEGRASTEQADAALARIRTIRAKSDATPDERREANQLENTIDGLRKQARTAKAKADQVQTLKRLKDMLDLAKTRAELVVDAAELDADEYLFNTLTGVVDLRDGRVYTHDPKRRITRLAPTDYNPDEPMGRLADVLDHLCQITDADGKVDKAATAELATFARDVLGNSLQGNNRLERFYVWQGPGGSGKGTLMEAIKSCTGDYTMTAEFQSFVRTQGARVRDDLARLAEARVVFASEVEAGEQMAAGVIKSITGRDTITARQLYGSYFEFRPRLTLHLQCNDLPRADDQDSGLWRRLVVIPCGPQIPDDKRDPNLKSWLTDPKAGGKAVLAWLIRGAIATHAEKHLKEPASVKAATAAYRIDQDPTKEFFAEAIRFASPQTFDRTRAAVTDVLKAYQLWCDANQLNPRLRCSPRTIAQRLEARGCYRDKVRHGAKTFNVWKGVAVPDTASTTEESALLIPSDHVPTVEEHEAALAAVPVFLCSASRKSPTHARARAPVCINSSEIEEHRNTGTEQEPPNTGPAGGPSEKPNPPTATDADGIDLGNL
jgi:putative DNA primase/helicase